MAKQFMFLKKIVYQFFLKDKTNPETHYRVSLQRGPKVGNEKIVENIHDHTGISRAYIAAVIEALPESINDYLEIGSPVELQNFLTLSPNITVKAVNTNAEATGATIKRAWIKAQAIGTFAEMTKKWGFRLVSDSAEAGEAEDENTEVVDPNDPNNQGNQGNQQQGGGTQQPAATKYTLTLKRANDTVISTTELEAGAAITYPTATSGYMWPADAPTVMPAQATTVTEVVDDDPNVL